MWLHLDWTVVESKKNANHFTVRLRIELSYKLERRLDSYLFLKLALRRLLVSLSTYQLDFCG